MTLQTIDPDAVYYADAAHALADLVREVLIAESMDQVRFYNKTDWRRRAAAELEKIGRGLPSVSHKPSESP